MYEICFLQYSGDIVGLRIFPVLEPTSPKDVDIDTFNSLGLKIKDVYRSISLYDYNGLMASEREIKTGRFASDISSNVSLVRQMIKVYNSLHSGLDIDVNLDTSEVFKVMNKYFIPRRKYSFEDRCNLAKDILRGIQSSLIAEMYDFSSPSNLQVLLKGFNLCLWYDYLPEKTRARVINDLVKLRPLEYICKKYVISMNLAVTVANKFNIPLTKGQLPKWTVEVIKAALIRGFKVKDLKPFVSSNNFVVSSIRDELGLDGSVNSFPNEIKENAYRMASSGMSVSNIADYFDLSFNVASRLLKSLGFNPDTMLVSEAEKAAIRHDIFTTNVLATLTSKYGTGRAFFSVAEEFGIELNIENITSFTKNSIIRLYNNGIPLESISEQLLLFHGIVNKVVREYKLIKPSLLKGLTQKKLNFALDCLYSKKFITDVADSLGGNRNLVYTIAHEYGIVLNLESLDPDTFNSIYLDLQSGHSVKELSLKYKVFYGLVDKMDIKLREGVLSLKQV